MPQGRKTSIMASAAIFILLEIAALAMLDRSSTLQDIWINRASHRTMAALWGTGEKLRNYFMLDEINERLVLQNDSLRRELEVFLGRQEAMKEATASSEAVNSLPLAENNALAAGSRFTFTPATIVKMSRNRPQNYVILNKGSDDGIVPQSGIITGRGVIGIVNSVSRHYAYGLTLMNPNVTVSARIGHEGPAAPLVWNGISTDGAVVTDIPPHYAISPGDTVWTSGFSSIFPEGIPIGITGESWLVDGSNQHVEVKLFQDFNSAHYVTVTRNMDLNEIMNLESAETEKEGRE